MYVIDTQCHLYVLSIFSKDAFPMRVKELHFFNEPAVFDLVFAIFKQVMKEKMMKRVSETLLYENVSFV